MRLRGSASILAGGVVALLAAAAPASADRYVDDDLGNDASATCSQASPCKTVQRGVNVAATNELVRIDGGTYAESVSLGNGKSLTFDEFTGDIEAGGAAINGGANPAVSVSINDAGSVSFLTLRSDSFVNTVYAPLGRLEVNQNVIQSGAAGAGSFVLLNEGGDAVGNSITDATPSDNQTAIRLGGSGSVRNNTIIGFRAGIEHFGASIDISGNSITGLHDVPATTGAVGIEVNEGSGPISNNLVSASVADNSSIVATGITVLDSNVDPTAPAVSLNGNLIITNGVDIRLADTTSASIGSSRMYAAAGATDVVGLSMHDTATFPGSADVSVSGSNFGSTDITVDAAGLTLDSSILFGSADITAISGGTCAISHSRGPTMTPGGDGCANFQTTVDPMLDPADGSHLLPGSPMIDAGNPAPVRAGVVDMDGQSRVIEGDGSCPTLRDIGADEYSPVPAFNINCAPLAAPAATGTSENPECAALRAKLARLKQRIKQASDPVKKAKLKQKRRKVRARLAALGC